MTKAQSVPMASWANCKSAAECRLMYWHNREKTKHTFAGEWTRSGDKYSRDADGYYTYGGRSDDMLKVGGIYVSPLRWRPQFDDACRSVLEAAVVGHADEEGLVKPKAFVVLKQGHLPPNPNCKPMSKANWRPTNILAGSIF
jgi:benzoate-CoA ligase